MLIPSFKMEDLPAMGHEPNIPPGHLFFDGEKNLLMSDGFMMIAVEVTASPADKAGWVSQDAIRYARAFQARNEDGVGTLDLLTKVCKAKDGALFPRPAEYREGHFARFAESMTVTLEREATKGLDKPSFLVDLVKLHAITGMLLEYLDMTATWIQETWTKEDEDGNEYEETHVVPGRKTSLGCEVWNPDAKLPLLFRAKDTCVTAVLMPMFMRDEL